MVEKRLIRECQLRPLLLKRTLVEVVEHKPLLIGGLEVTDYCDVEPTYVTYAQFTNMSCRPAGRIPWIIRE